MIGQVIFTAGCVLLGVTWAFVPIMKGADAFFGVPVSEEFMRGPQGRRYLHTYWLLLALFVIVSMASLWLFSLLTGAMVVVAALAVGIEVVFVVMFYLVRRHQVISPADPVAAELERRNRWQYINWPLEGLCLALIAASWSYFAVSYAYLPPPLGELLIASGQPTSPDWGNIGLYLLMQPYVFVLWLVMMIVMAQSAVRLSANASSDYLGLRREYMRMMVGMFYAGKLTGITLLGAIAGLPIWAAAAASGQSISVGALAVLLILMSGAFGYYGVKMYRLRALMRELVGPGGLERSADHGGWVAGFIYFNPQDPSLWVERRIGYGYTFNLARWETWLLVMIFTLPVFVIWWLII